MSEIRAFRNYLIEKKYAETTIYSYSNSINTISEHMSKLRGYDVDLYKIYDTPRLEKIRQTYGLDGNHAEFGNRGNGTIRNAINRFVEFREWENDDKKAVLKEGFSFREEEKEDELSILEDMMGELVLLKMKINEINKKTNLITALIISHVVIFCILVYILFQL